MSAMSQTPHFPIYMDYGATTPVDPRVVDAMVPWLYEHFGNAASRSHAWGWEAEKAIEKITELGFGGMPVCMAKTQYSLSDDPTKLGRPEGFTITVREVYVSAGAGFIVVLTGSVMTMPGLPKQPAAYSIDVNDEGRITGLF